MTDRWTIAAALGTALFVAWQAFETRRATNANRRAVQASQAVAVDAARARIDENAPRLQVHMNPPAWPPLEPSLYLGGEPNPHPAGKEWHFPRDAKESLMLQVQVVVKNLGERSAQVRFEGSIRKTSANDPQPVAPVLLSPNEELAYFLEASFPVSRWAENWHAHQRGDPLPTVAEAAVICIDDRDTGVVDTWRLRLTGWPIQPVEDREGVWQLKPLLVGTPAPRCIEFEMQPLRQRVYWLSQSQGIPLPEPVYSEPVSLWQQAVVRLLKPRRGRRDRSTG